jgi:hypothetical protein
LESERRGVALESVDQILERLQELESEVVGASVSSGSGGR